MTVESSKLSGYQIDNVAQAIANLDAWLETMRQPGGYGGPVAHWWQNRYRYTGPGLDWRYEGILIGYYTLLQKTRSARWCQCLNQAAMDLMNGQLEDGSYRASSFEMNPAALGTPHEAAATLGLLTVLPCLNDKERALEVAKRNLDNLIAKLWDGRGFNDRPGICGRVPNKLATLAQALMVAAKVSGDESYLPYAEAALRNVLHFQVEKGGFAGAVHQYAPSAGRGDGRFFPYYNARCIPPLLQASKVFAEERYLHAAHRILNFIHESMYDDGSWPQIVYANGKRANWPRWIAGAADMLLAYRALGKAVPDIALTRLLASQLPSGGFPTAEGFSSQLSQQRPGNVPDYRDVTPVAGWNDKVLKLLCALLELQETLPKPCTRETSVLVMVGQSQAVLQDNRNQMSICAENAYYLWVKQDPWARVTEAGVDIR